MPEKRRKNVQTCLWIAAIAIPAGECSHGAGVTQIVQSRGRDARWDRKMEPPNELLKSDADGARIYGPAAFQSEQWGLRVRWTAAGFPDTELRCVGRLERSNGEGSIAAELQAGV